MRYIELTAHNLAHYKYSLCRWLLVTPTWKCALFVTLNWCLIKIN